MKQCSASAWEHYTIALIDVEYCSALHVEEKAKRIQLVPKHSVCLCLCTVSRVCLSGWTVRLQFHHTHTHTHTRWAQGRPRKRVGAIKQWAGFSSPLITPSLFRPIYLSVAAMEWMRLCGSLCSPSGYNSRFSRNRAARLWRWYTQTGLTCAFICKLP